MTNRTYLVVLLAAGCLAASALGADPKAAATKGERRVASRWAILVGVDDYAEAEKLRYSGADMRELAKQLVIAGFPQQQVFLLDDKADDSKYRPLKVNIERQLDLVLGLVEREDLVVVAFSGHGVHIDTKSFLCPTEARLTEPGTLISLDTVYERLNKCPAALKLLLVDACRNDPRVGGQKSLGKPTEVIKQFASSLEHPPEGILLLSSCAPGQVSMEESEFGHGVFMNYVLDGLRGQADSDKNGHVSLLELYKYANRETKLHVARRYNGYQTPALKGDIADDFDLTVATVNLQVADALARGRALMTAEKYHEALAAFEEAVKYDPKNADAYERCGVAWSWLDDDSQAIANYTKAIAIDPTKAQYFANRAQAYKNLQQIDKALDDLTAAVRLDPRTADYHHRRASFYRAREQFDKALADWQEALKLDPSNADYHNYAGLMHNKLEHANEAVAEYSEAVRLDPKSAIYLANRGVTRRNLKQYDAAVADFTAAMKLDPKYDELYSMRGRAYLFQRQLSASLADYDEYLRRCPKDADAYSWRGDAYYYQRNYQAAVADYTRAMELNPENSEYVDDRGETYYAMNQADEAIRDFTAAIRLSPKHHTYYNHRGDAYCQKKDYDTAIADYSEAIRLNPDSYLAYFNRGWSYYMSERYPLAISDLTEAIRRKPDDAALYNWRGQARRYGGQYDAAIADYTEALRLNPQFARAFQNRAAAYIKKSQPGPAQADLDRARAVRVARDIAPGTLVSVINSDAKVQNESQVVATLQLGQSLRVVESRGEWILVKVNGQTGWLSKADVD